MSRRSPGQVMWYQVVLWLQASCSVLVFLETWWKKSCTEPGFCRGRHVKRKGGQTKTLHHPNFNWLQNCRWTGMETCMSSVLAYFVHFKSFVWHWWGRFVLLGHFLVFVVCVCVWVCVCVCVWVRECRWCDFCPLCHLTGVLRWRREGSPAQRASSMWTCGRWTTPPSTSWSSRPSSPAPWTTADTCTGEWAVALVMMTPGHLVLSDW